VAGGHELEREFLRQSDHFVVIDRLQAPEGFGSVSFGVERQRRFMLRRPGLVGVSGVLFLQPRRIWEQDARQFDRRRRAVDRPVEAVTRESRQIACVVNVRVSQDHRVDRRRVEGERFPVPQPQFLQALEQPAINHRAVSVNFDKVFRPGDGASRAQKLHCRH
jgi:hypothetical protein